MADDTDPIVGHKTFRHGSGFRHEPLRKSEADDIMAKIDAAKAKRASDMPTEQDAIRAMFAAWQRLRELGWREGRSMPTTGERFAAVTVGSTGVHSMTAERCGDGPFAPTAWTTYDGDIWPSSHPPALFRPWRDSDVQHDYGICAPIPASGGDKEKT